MSEPAAARTLALVESLADERRELAETWGVSEDDLIARLRSSGLLSVEEICDAADVLRVPSTYLAGQSDSFGFAVALRVGTIETTEAPAALLNIAGVLLDNVKLLNTWQGATPRPLEDMDVVRTGFHVRDGQKTAERVRAVLGLGDEPITDLTVLVESLGYPAVHLDMPKGLCGMTARDDRDGVVDRVIMVNVTEDWARQRFTLAHEVGHCLFDDLGQVIVDKIEESDRAEEMRSNAFARHFLLPASALRVRLDAARAASVPADTLVPQVALDFGVSREVVINALTSDGLITPDHPALRHTVALSVGDLMAAAGLSDQLEERKRVAAAPRPSSTLSERARSAYRSGWVHPRIVAEVEGRELAEVEAELRSEGSAQTF